MRVDNTPLKWFCNETLFEKNCRGCPDSVMSFLNLTLPESLHSPIVWRQHPADPVETLDLWPAGDSLVLPRPFPKLTFSSSHAHLPSLRCSGFWETLAFYSFQSRRNTGVIYCVSQMNSTWGILIGHTAIQGRNNTRVYREAEQVNTLLSLYLVLETV